MTDTARPTAVADSSEAQMYHSQSRRTGRATGHVAMTALAIAAMAAQAQSRAQERACAALADWSSGPDDLTITEARFYANRTVAVRPGVEMALPPHCHVVGSFERRTGIDGKEYAIGFALNLPTEWN